MQVRPTPVLSLVDRIRILRIALEDIALGAIDINQAISLANKALLDSRIYKDGIK